MKLIKTPIQGLFILKPNIFHDERGYFMESYNCANINNLLGNLNFVQDNESESSRGVLRGLHFQKPPFTQAKLIRCLKGKILDIAVDLRTDSNTYGQFCKTILSSSNKNQLFISKGFAHGFIVLSDSAVVSYKVDNYYNPKFESGILWNDVSLNIDWEVNPTETIVSTKDENLPTLHKLINPF